MDQYDIAVPKPASLIESLRAVGYDFRTAIADIIDNSIAAHAKNIELQFVWDGENSTVSIRDNGIGMNANDLVRAMTLGSISPLEERSATDLGRYGLGLKTASFSQCRDLRVISQSEHEAIAGREWDLDYIIDSGEWRLLALTQEDISDVSFTNGHGTLVQWRTLDHLTKGTSKDSQQDQDNFLRNVDIVRDHLSMVYHRFLSQPNGPKIFINGRKLAAWEPFMSGETATQTLTVETLTFHGSTVLVRPHVLPHHSKLSTDRHTEGGGTEGWNAQQGFYVYRNKRLLVAGDWLGLGFQKEEHYKLARIQLDIPNSMDDDWRIDIKKSHAMPPPELRKDLKRIASVTRKHASEVYRHRGKILTRSTPGAVNVVWVRGEKNGQVIYRVNRNHPALDQILSGSSDKKALLAIIKIIEDTMPAAAIVADWNEKPMDQLSTTQEATRRKEISQLAGDVLDILISHGKNTEDSIAILQHVEPFDEFPEILEALKERV